MNWFRRTPVPRLATIAFANGMFVAGTGAGPDSSGSLWTSLDGVEWALQQNTPAGIQDITYGAGRWLAVARTSPYSDGGIIFVSNDAQAWTTTHTNSATILGIGFGAGHFIATLENGTVLLSPDSTSWMNPLPDPLDAVYGWRDVTYSEGRFVAVDALGIAISPNGITWTHGPTITNLGEYVSLYTVAYGNGLYVVGGDYRTLAVSADGVTWTNPVPELQSRPYVSEINDVIYANGLFVAVGGYRGSILTSSNGVQWSLKDLVTDDSEAVYLRSAAYGNGS